MKASRSTAPSAPVVDMTTLLYAAVGYASAWPVFPCHTPKADGCTCGRRECPSPGKHPRTRNGVHDATTDRATVAGWWRHWPRANIAMATGQPSGVVVIDVDSRHGGHQAWRTLLAGRPILAPVVATGSRLARLVRASGPAGAELVRAPRSRDRRPWRRRLRHRPTQPAPQRRPLPVAAPARANAPDPAQLAGGRLPTGHRRAF